MNNSLFKYQLYLLRKSNKAKQIVRKNNRRKYKVKKQNKIQKTWKSNYYCEIAEYLMENVSSIKLDDKTLSSLTIEIPRNFSFCENTDDTIAVYENLIAICKTDPLQEIVIDFSNCDAIGLGAAFFLGQLMESIKIQNKYDHTKDRGKRISFQAKTSSKEIVNVIAGVSGVYKDIHSGGLYKFPELFPVIIGHESSYVATKIIKYFNRCLSKNNYSFNKSARQLMVRLVSEVVDNCSIHGGKDPKWATYAWYNNTRKAYEYGECHIVIVNTGDTIYQGLRQLGYENNLAADLRKLSGKHSGLFSKKGYTEESLWTLYSLQQGVSRLQGHDVRRGSGTYNYIESFLSLGNHTEYRSQMSINSGRASIYIDGTYNFHDIKDIDDSIIKVLTFNDSNSFDEPPDLHFVRALKRRFPGTMVSIRIGLSEEEVEKNDANRFEQL